METGDAGLGVFWFVRANDGRIRLLAHVCAPADVEPYGDCLTCPHAHIDVWHDWAAGRGVAADLLPVIRAAEYEEWPRGRIVLDRASGFFVLYSDPRLLHARFLDQIRERFALPRERTKVMTDGHYRSTRRLSK